MRTIEVLLVLTNILTFFTLILPLPGSLQWLRYLALVGPALAGGQALCEGLRWQMAPAYLLSGLLYLGWVTGWRPDQRLVYGLGALALIVSGALPVVHPAYRFPKPGGPYEISTLTYHWIDESRAEIFSQEPGDYRELIVQIWYPARTKPSSVRAPYIQDPAALASGLSKMRHLPQFLFGNLRDIHGNAYHAAPIAEAEPGYPVLIFTEGLTGFRQMNTFQVEELVSRGYIVAAIDQPYAAATVIYPDGHRVDVPPIYQVRPVVRASYIPAEEVPTLNGKPLRGGSIIPYLAQDVSFVLNRLVALNEADPNGILTGRLDLERTGIFGVSLGGITAAEACRIDPRLRACLMMDAPMPVSVVKDGLSQPAMWITREAKYMRLERERSGGWAEDEIEAHQASMRAVYNSLPADGYFVQIPGIFHIDFTDVPVWSPLYTWLGLSGPNGIQRSHAIINGYSAAFFDRHVMGRSGTTFDYLVALYPDVALETVGTVSTPNPRP